MNLNTIAPQRCHEGLGTSTPTVIGRYLIAHPIDMVALLRLPRAAVLNARDICQKRRVCVATATHQYLSLRILRRGLLAVFALCAWQSAAGQAPIVPAAIPETITVREVVLDDSLNVPIPGIWLYLNDTKYGAITDAQGAFTFSFPTTWKPLRVGMLTIKVATAPFTFKLRRVPLDWRTYDPANPLTIRLASAPGRGRPNLHGYIWMAPPLPPPVYPPRSHMGRP